MPSSTPSGMPLFFSHVFPWLLVLIGASFLRTALGKWARAMRSKRWPTVEGRIVSCGFGSHSPSEDGAEIRFAKIEYRYSVDGAEHVGSRISFADLSHTGAAAESYVKHHPVGLRVPVHYDPLRPEDSLLEPGVRVQVFVRICFALAVFGTGAVLVFAFHSWRS